MCYNMKSKRVLLHAGAILSGVATSMTDRSTIQLLIFSLLISIFIAFVLLVSRTNSVQGVVVDADTGVPLAGCRVNLFDGGTLETDEAGRFSLRTPRGAFPLQITSAAYQPLDARCDASRYSLKPVACRFALQPEELTIQAIDALDQTVVISDARVIANGLTLVRGGDGLYAGKRFESPVEVSVIAAGYLPWIGQGANNATIQARLQPTRLSGVVRAADTGETLAGVRVEVLGQITETDRQGRFEYLRVAGPVQPRARIVGFQNHYGALVEAETILAGDPVELLMEPVFTPGSVRDYQTGLPIAGATITTEDQRVTTDADGAFRLRALLLDTHIDVEAEDYFSAALDYVGQRSLDASLQSQIAEVIVSDTQTGRRLDDARIDTELGSVFTDDDGYVTLRGLHPGQPIAIQAAHYYSETVTYSGRLRTEVSLRQIRNDIVVYDSLTGLPIVGAIISTPAGDVTTDAGGQCTVIGMLPGYSTTVTAENHVPLTLTYAGEDPLAVSMSPVQVQFQVVDRDSGEGIPGLRVEQAGAQVWLAGNYYTISDWNAEPVFSFRAAGYRKHQFTFSPVRLEHVGDSEQPALFLSVESTGRQPVLRLEIPRFTVRAIYVPFGLLTRPDIIDELMALVESTELNAVVIDMKGDRGYLGYRSLLPLAGDLRVNRRDVMDIRDLLQRCREAGIYTIARQVVFKDHPLSTTKPEWAATTAEGAVWLDKEALGWANPFLQEVRDYNVGIAMEIAALGFDEIQFDYLRFPSDGDVKQIVYEQENTPATRSAAITQFVDQVTTALRPYDIFTSADVFGLTIWVEPWEDMGIGQRVLDIGPYVDYLCPMVYPSTFGPGNLGYDNPAAYPYEVIYRSVLQAQARVPASTKVRPWLQAYWYTLDEYLLQKQAAIDSDASGWCFWNAGGKYMPALFEVE